MAHTIQLRGGTSALATSTNPVLHDREMGVETDTVNFKIGDGVTAWTSLPYGGLQGIQGPQGEEGASFLDGGNFSTIYQADQYIDGGPF